MTARTCSRFTGTSSRHPTKRLGWTAVVVFYRLNACRITAPEDDAYDLVIAVASGAAGLDVISPALASWRRPA